MGPPGTTDDAACFEWDTDQGAALLAADILDRAAWRNAVTPHGASAQQAGQRLSSLPAIVALTRRTTGGKATAPPGRSTASVETEIGSSKADEKDRGASAKRFPTEDTTCWRELAAGNGRSDALPLAWSESKTLRSAVLESMVMLVDAAGAPRARSASSVESGTSAASVGGPVDGSKSGRQMPPASDHHQGGRSRFSKPSPLPHGHTGRGIEAPSLPQSLPPPPPPPPLSGLGTVSPAAGVEVSGLKREETQRSDRSIVDQTGTAESAQVDTDNRRRVLFAGVLTMLQELFGEEGEREPERSLGRQKRGRGDAGDGLEQTSEAEQETKSRAWVSEACERVLYAASLEWLSWGWVLRVLLV